MTDTKITRALLSAHDKSGLASFASALAARGVELVSSGGTARALREAGIDARDVAELTGFPEMMDGRVKTLHPQIHGGILGVRGNPKHEASMTSHAIAPIDLVVVNLYPFEATVRSGADDETCIENIDIGGPALIRGAAKNHASVTVVVDPSDYGAILSAMDENGGATPLDLRRKLALKAYAATAAYDAAIAGWFASRENDCTSRIRAFAGHLSQVLRYGENPHQWAAFYRNAEQRSGIATAEQVQGKELSYNNLNDTDAAYELVAEFDKSRPAVAIIKHANPCGVALGDTLKEAYEKALACDPVSAFGGIVALNCVLDANAASEIVRIFTEVIIAPDATDEAKAIIADKKNLRLLLAGALPDPAAPGETVRTLSGGLLVQARDNAVIDKTATRVVTKRQPTDRERADLDFAFRVAKHVKSNAIVYAKEGATVGIGAGQMSRVDSARIAARKAEDAAVAQGLATPLTQGSVVASDAFYPFADGLLSAVEAGATAVIQPGGSMRDDEVIQAADDAGLAMIFTGMRHFRH